MKKKKTGGGTTWKKDSCAQKVGLIESFGQPLHHNNVLVDAHAVNNGPAV